MSNRSPSWITQKFRSVLDVVRVRKFQSNYVALERNRPIMSATRNERSYGMHPGQRFYSTNSKNSSTSAEG